jgi:DNA invertase Pin-like site-specific DNA recombinase
MALEQRGIALKSITEPHIDTSTPGGRLVFNIFGSIADYAESGMMQSVVAETEM